MMVGTAGIFQIVGAVLMLIGIGLFARGKDHGDSSIDVLGQSFKTTTPSLIIFAGGLLLFIFPYSAAFRAQPPFANAVDNSSGTNSTVSGDLINAATDPANGASEAPATNEAQNTIPVPVEKPRSVTGPIQGGKPTLDPEPHSDNTPTLDPSPVPDRPMLRPHRNPQLQPQAESIDNGKLDQNWLDCTLAGKNTKALCEAYLADRNSRN